MASGPQGNNNFWKNNLHFLSDEDSELYNHGTPEIILITNMILRAMCDLCLSDAYKEIKRDARQWILSDSDSAFSFMYCLDEVGLSTYLKAFRGIADNPDLAVGFVDALKKKRIFQGQSRAKFQDKIKW